MIIVELLFSVNDIMIYKRISDSILLNNERNFNYYVNYYGEDDAMSYYDTIDRNRISNYFDDDYSMNIFNFVDSMSCNHIKYKNNSFSNVVSDLSYNAIALFDEAKNSIRNK